MTDFTTRSRRRLSSSRTLRALLLALLPLLLTAALAGAADPASSQRRSLRIGSSTAADRTAPELSARQEEEYEEARALYPSDDNTSGNGNSTSPTSSSATRRVIIHQFDVLLTSSMAAGGSSSGILASSSSSEGQQQLKALHEAAEVTIQTYMEGVQSNSNVKSILLGAVAVSSTTTTNEPEAGSNETPGETYSYFETARVSFGKGVVNFVVASSGSSGIPTSYQVNVWVQEAIDKGLLQTMQDSNSTGGGGFRSNLPISQVEYVQLVDNPRPVVVNDTEPPRNSSTDGVQGGGDGSSNTSASSGLNVTLLIVLCAVGFAVVVSAVGLVAMRRRNQQAFKGKDPTRYVEQRNPEYSIKEMMDDALEDETTSKDDPTGGVGVAAVMVTANAKQKKTTKREGSTASDDDLNTTRETIKASSVASNSPGRQSVASAASSHASSAAATDQGRNSSRLNGSGYFSARSSTKSRHPGGSDKGLNETMDGGRSVAGESESDFTVNTEAGDSLALQSVSGYQPSSSNPGLPPHQRQQQQQQQPPKTLVPPPPFAATESFQRERPVSLQKDMLVSSWSGGSRPFLAASGSGGAGSGNLRVSSASPTSSSIRMVPQVQQQGLAQSDSVLSPSHFVAAEEKRKGQPRGLSGRLSVSTSWGQRRPQPQLEEEVTNVGQDEEGDDTDYDGSASVDSLASPSDDDRNRSSGVGSSSSSSSFSVPAPSLLGRRRNGGSRRKSPTVPQTPPSATSRQRFVGPPRPSPGNVV